MFVPNDDGTSFDLPTEVDEIPAILVVEGTPLSDLPSPANHQQQVIPPPAPAVERQPAIAPIRKSQQQCNVKVERAEILGWSPAGKPDLHSRPTVCDLNSGLGQRRSCGVNGKWFES